MGELIGANASKPGTVTPNMDGTAAIGTSTSFARQDHAHPTDTSRAASSHTHTASAITNFAATVIATVLTGLSTATSSVIAATDSILAALGKLQAQITTHLADYTLQVPYGGVTTGSANTYVLSAPAISALTAGMAVSIKINVDSTATSTLNWNGKGAKSILKANGTAVTNLKATGIYTLRYDGTNFILQGEGGFGNAAASDLLSGKTATTDAGDITGTMPNKVGSATVITPSIVDQAIPQGYFGGIVADGKVKGDSNHIAANIKNGIIDFGVTGLLHGFVVTSGDTTTMLTGGTSNLAVHVSVYTKERTLNVGNIMGTIRITFGIYTDNALAITYGKVYKNDIAVGTERSTSSLTDVLFTEDFAVVPGDIFSIWIYVNNTTYYARLSNNTTVKIVETVSLGTQSVV